MSPTKNLDPYPKFRCYSFNPSLIDFEFCFSGCPWLTVVLLTPSHTHSTTCSPPTGIFSLKAASCFHIFPERRAAITLTPSLRSAACSEFAQGMAPWRPGSYLGLLGAVAIVLLLPVMPREYHSSWYTTEQSLSTVL